MPYLEESQILNGLKHYIDNEEELDIDVYEIVDSYLTNPFNIDDKQMEIIEELISESIETKFDVYSPLPDEKTLSNTLRYIKPCKLSKPLAPIKVMYSKGYKNNIHFPVRTNIKRLKRGASG